MDAPVYNLEKTGSKALREMGKSLAPPRRLLAAAVTHEKILAEVGGASFHRPT